MRASFYKWFVDWYLYNGIFKNIDIFISYVNELDDGLYKNCDKNSLLLNVFKRNNENVDEIIYLIQILHQADKHKTTIYLKLNDHINVTKDELLKYGFKQDVGGYLKRKFIKFD